MNLIASPIITLALTPVSASNVKAYDSQGRFPIKIIDSFKDTNIQELHGLRNVVGALLLHLHVQPIEVTEKHHRRPIAPLGVDSGRTELLEDHGGIMGARRCPVGSLLLSFGHASNLEPFPTRPITKEVTIDTMLDSIDMVGPVKCIPAHADAATGDASPNVGATFWFGILPSNLQKLSAYSSNIFPRLSAFFRDTQESYYQASIQNVPVGFGETGLQSSSLVEFGQRGPEYFRNTPNGFLSPYDTGPHLNTDNTEQ
ncbi:hypothetical protein CORC01_01598 [Colletotrichum orchidophilum]|uniref:Uncharacterized protein n=1 Tax=Colletotrichum orchidophilum TaxID=1209926 RepID=A0A1G4BP63_9PEZI|nr:uncharacterized protein CORC01_01598 [Colletotrichum orchidophilum]OHF03214.1 hypothetical protein CORC01_01598 [Colletotrichum orchidophilum]